MFSVRHSLVPLLILLPLSSSWPGYQSFGAEISPPPLPSAPMKPMPSPGLPPVPDGIAQPPLTSGTRTIEVSGNSEVQAAPDLATLEVAIETHAATADHAAGLNGALAEKVRDALTAKLANKGTLWTGGYSLFPEYSEPHDGKPTITGYRAENSITVQTGELGIIGPLIDAAIAAGANRIDSLNYSLRADS